MISHEENQFEATSSFFNDRYTAVHPLLFLLAYASVVSHEFCYYLFLIYFPLSDSERHCLVIVTFPGSTDICADRHSIVE